MTHVPLQDQQISYRTILPHDFTEVKAMHSKLFPIDYEDNFFHKVCKNEDRIFSYAAVLNQPCSQVPSSSAPRDDGKPRSTDEVIGFVTARTIFMHECDPMDRHYIGKSSRLLDRQSAIYVLTLGVAPKHQRKGIAQQLLSLVQRHAASSKCCVVFLHVITYNESALRLYSRAGYTCVGLLQNFYYINSGRQPELNRIQYDAWLYALNLPELHEPMSCASYWSLPWAFSPFSTCVGTRGQAVHTSSASTHAPMQSQPVWFSPKTWASGSKGYCSPWSNGASMQSQMSTVKSNPHQSLLDSSDIKVVQTREDATSKQISGYPDAGELQSGSQHHGSASLGYSPPSSLLQYWLYPQNLSAKKNRVE